MRKHTRQEAFDVEKDYAARRGEAIRFATTESGESVGGRRSIIRKQENGEGRSPPLLLRMRIAAGRLKVFRLQTGFRLRQEPGSFLLVVRDPKGCSWTPSDFCWRAHPAPDWMSHAMSSAPANPAPDRTKNAAAMKPGIPDYQLMRVVGRGSYGDVWLARSVTGAWRAIKVVWRDRFDNAEPFEREFRGLKEFAEVSLGESTQMALLHVGRNDASGFFYYVMELADDAERGRHIDPETYVPLTLAEMRARRGRIPADECARIGVELARVLATLHRRGLVHRDVKPSNVILVSGVPKLADIGLVAPSASAHTFVGTEGYVPPEGPGAPSADVFALAKVLYELSTGNDRQEFPKLPAELAALPDRAALLELNEIFLRACGPATAERYRDGAAILTDLTALNAGISLRTRRFARRVLRVAASLALLATLAWGAWQWQHRAAPPPPPAIAGISPRSVAVLPLTNATGDPAEDYFADGISDEIRRALERERELRVTGGPSSCAFKRATISAVEIAQRLGVAHLVEGALERTGPRPRLHVRLTRGADGASVDLGIFEGGEHDAFALEDAVARAVAQKILPRTTMPPMNAATRNPEAYREFLRGRALQLQGTDHAAEAVTCLERAVALDPQFALAWARLADARRMEGQRNSHGTWRDIAGAREAAVRALALQPDLPLAWTVHGFILGVGGNNPTEGLRDVMHAEGLGGPTAETLMTRLLIQCFASEVRGLLTPARDAIALNPENLERVHVLNLALWYLGGYAEADRLYRQAGNFALYRHADNFVARVHVRRTWRGAAAALRLAERFPEHPASLGLRVRLLAELGQVTKAAQLLQNVAVPQGCEVYAAAGLVDRARARAAEELPERRRAFSEFPRMPRNDLEGAQRTEARARLIQACLVLDDRAAARELLDGWRRELQPPLPENRRAGGIHGLDLPRFYALLGEHELALDLLRQFMEFGRSLGYDLRDPAFDALRGDPGFLNLRQQAEARAALQPDPADDPLAKAQP